MNADEEQNTRIRALEEKMTTLTSDVAALTAQLTTLTSVGRGLAILCGAAIGVDVIPMLGSGA